MARYPTHNGWEHDSHNCTGLYDCCHYGSDLYDNDELEEMYESCFCDRECGKAQLIPGKYGDLSKDFDEKNTYAFCVDCVIKAIQTLKWLNKCNMCICALIII